MEKKSKKALFKQMRWVYMVFAIIAIICFIVVLAVPSVIETVNNAVPSLSESLGGVDVKYYLLAILGFSALWDIWYFYLIKRCADGKSNGTLLLVLLSLRVITAIVAIFTTKTPINIDAIIDAITLFDLIRYRNENK